MRDALYRLTSPILDRIPDISHQPKGRQISIGLAASLLLLFAIWLISLLPHGHGSVALMRPPFVVGEPEDEPPPYDHLRFRKPRSPALIIFRQQPVLCRGDLPQLPRRGRQRAHDGRLDQGRTRRVRLRKIPEAVLRHRCSFMVQGLEISNRRG